MCKSLHSELSMRFLALILALGAITCPQGAAQAPTAAPPNPGQQTTAVPTAQPQPGDTGAAPLALTLQDALARARTTNQQYLSATISAQLAHEDRVQAKAALLPTVNYFNQFIYTEPNGTPSGVFVANDGPHVYNSQGIVHGDIFAPGKRAEYQRAIAAEAVARAKADVAARGLIATVVQNYYGLVTAARKTRNAQQSLREAEQFMDITRKQEGGGEVAHSDVVKAQIQLEQRQRDAQEARLNEEKS